MDLKDFDRQLSYAKVFSNNFERLFGLLTGDEMTP